MSLPITYHRVLHTNHEALKPEHRVRPSDAKIKNGFCYWPLDIALRIATYFPDSATVDNVGLYEEDFES